MDTHNIPDTDSESKVFVDLPTEIWKQAKKNAIDKGMTAKQYVAEAVIEKVEREAA